MADANQVGVGRINLSSGVGYDGAGDKYATYLKLFSGEMFKGFQHNTIARDLVTKRTLKNGKSLQFIYTCLLYTSPSPRDATLSRMPSSA